MCRLSMSGEAFEQELRAWIVVREPAGAAAVRQAAAPGSETALFDQMWRSRHAIANQALMTAGKLHPDPIAQPSHGPASTTVRNMRSDPGCHG